MILTTFDLDEYVFAALQAGACGFLLKDVAANQLAAGVRMVAAGDALLAPSITRRLIEEFAVSRPQAPEQVKELTPREMEIFLLVAKGMSNAEIAAKLVIGETTVKTHVTRLLMKLGVRDRIQAVVLAYEAGLARPSQRSQ
jgi:DNA-binding NarL/FixJ family response regulator